MAEVIAAIAIVASVAQLADYGFKLSVKLFTFSQAVSSADQSIKGISNDVSLTSTVLQELSLIFKADESRVVSAGAIEATRKTVEECMKVFAELEEALDKSLGNLGQGDGGKAKGKVGRGMIALEKLKWPFKQPKMELLRSNLDRLKVSLTLMLQVLSYARDVSNRKAAESSLAYQQHLIETLAHSERAMKQRYYSLQMAIENQCPHTFAAASVSISAATRSRGIDDFRSPSPPPQYQKPSSPPPVVKPKTLVGELLLCFHLLNDLLGHHVAVTKSSELSWLTQTLERAQKMEMKRLEVDFHEASPELKAEAARNLHARLRELARVGYLKKRVLEGATGIADDARSEPESSDIRPIEASLSSAPRQGVMKMPQPPIRYAAIGAAPPSPTETSSTKTEAQLRDERLTPVQQTATKIHRGGRGYYYSSSDNEEQEQSQSPSARKFPDRPLYDDGFTKRLSKEQRDSLRQVEPGGLGAKPYNIRDKYEDDETCGYRRSRSTSRERPSSFLSPSREEYETDKGLQEGERYKAKEEEERKKNAGIYQGITTTSPSQQPQSQASPILSSQSSQNHGHSTNQVLNPPPAPDAQTKLPYQIDGVTREQAAMAATAAASGQPYPYKPGEGGLPQTKTSLAQRSKYQFEADSSDDEIENEINEHLAILGQQAGRLNALARATDQEIDDQNKHIDRIIRKSDRVDHQIAMNRARLDRIDQAGRLNQLATLKGKEVDTQQEHIPKTENKPPPPDTAAFDDKRSEADPHEEALAAMRTNIEKVQQRGEKIDTLVDNTMGRDPLAVQSAIFRKQAREPHAVKRANPWNFTFRSVPKLGSGMYKGFQGFGSSIYGASAALVSESGQRGDGNGLYKVNAIGNADPSRFEDMGGEQGDEDIVGDLLAKWTTLPSYEEATAGD